MYEVAKFQEPRGTAPLIEDAAIRNIVQWLWLPALSVAVPHEPSTRERGAAPDSPQFQSHQSNIGCQRAGKRGRLEAPAKPTKPQPLQGRIRVLSTARIQPPAGLQASASAAGWRSKEKTETSAITRERYGSFSQYPLLRFGSRSPLVLDRCGIPSLPDDQLSFMASGFVAARRPFPAFSHQRASHADGPMNREVPVIGGPEGQKPAFSDAFGTPLV